MKLEGLCWCCFPTVSWIHTESCFSLRGETVSIFTPAVVPWSAKAEQTLLGHATVLLQEIRLWRSITTASSINTSWQGNHRDVGGSGMRLTTKPARCARIPRLPPAQAEGGSVVTFPPWPGFTLWHARLLSWRNGFNKVEQIKGTVNDMAGPVNPPPGGAEGPGLVHAAGCCWMLQPVLCGTRRTLVWMVFNCYLSSV